MTERVTLVEHLSKVVEINKQIAALENELIDTGYRPNILIELVEADRRFTDAMLEEIIDPPKKPLIWDDGISTMLDAADRVAVKRQD
ncbi:hypothetical protein HY389_00340 [Candidatus Daviesbacteria bacterium]|nr:hypothetical protein [Candidatus Daviesbacteria bacterium]